MSVSLRKAIFDVFTKSLNQEHPIKVGWGYSVEDAIVIDKYDRIDEGDVKIVDDTKINEIYFRKRKVFTEGEIYRHLSLEDLDPKLFDNTREIIRASNPSHPLLELSNMDILRATSLYRKDFKTGEEGFTLVSALIFGKK